MPGWRTNFCLAGAPIDLQDLNRWQLDVLAHIGLSHVPQLIRLCCDLE